MRLLRILASLTVLLLTLTVFGMSEWFQQQTKQRTDETWTKTSGGFQIQVSAAEMKAVRTSDNQTVFSASALTHQGFNAYSEMMKEENVGRCMYSRTFRPLSLVNTLLTFSDELFSSCDLEAHPSSSYRVTTIDLSSGETLTYASLPDDPLTLNGENGAIRQLTDIFKREDILHALQQDPLLKQNLSSLPASLSELPKTVDDSGLEMLGTSCRFTLSPDYLSRFTLHHLMGANVAVRIELAPIGGACRNAKADSGILLPMPANLRASLNNADSLRSGFLAKDAPKTVKTQIQYST